MKKKEEKKRGKTQKKISNEYSLSTLKLINELSNFNFCPISFVNDFTQLEKISKIDVKNIFKELNNKSASNVCKETVDQLSIEFSSNKKYIKDFLLMQNHYFH